MESEFFGHERGAFTGALEQKKGLLELAERGTVFLDEIGEVGPEIQAKLLRFLDDRTLRRVGGIQDIVVDVRVIAATNRDLEEAVAQGQFREDLYFRLKVVPIDLPPLKARTEDIGDLVSYFINKFNREFRKNTQNVSEDMMSCLLRYSWPGNVRELRNVIERAMILENKNELELTDLPQGILDPTSADEEERGDPPRRGRSIVLPEKGLILSEVERDLIQQAWEHTGGHQTRAAALLGISRYVFHYKMKKYGLL
jgi:transcriptional regulator with PAS, ATPase and Fis domain